MTNATAPHTRIDNAIIDDMLPKIGVYGLTIYTVIKRHLNFTTGQCNPSYGRIAKMIGIDRSTAIRYVKKLQDLGLLSASIRFNEDGSPTSNPFYFSQTAQKSITAHKGSSRKQPPLVAEDNHPGRPAPPEQSSLNKLIGTKGEASNNEISVSVNHAPGKPGASNQGTEKPVACEKTAPTEKTENQKKCLHPYSEVVTFGEGITICNHCYDLINFLPGAEAA
jgi:hypothetical protein